MQQLVLKKSSLKQGRDRSKGSKQRSNSGFTLIELIVVILIVSILSAIAAPAWLSFIQRQRLSKTNDAVFSAIQQAQSEAKKTKFSYSASFKNVNNTLQVAVYPAKDADGSIVDTSGVDVPWRNLNGDLDVKPEQITLCSNIDPNSGRDATKVNKTAAISCDLSSPRTITFDYQGNLPLGSAANIGILLARPQPNKGVPPNNAMQRCVKVTNLLGSIQTGKTKTECF